MSANGISRLPYKRDRQEAKLNLAAISRAAQGKPAVLDLSLLPVLYGIEDNSPSALIFNEHSTGLLAGRPWTSAPTDPDPVFPEPASIGSGVSTVEQSPFGSGTSYLLDGSADSVLFFDGSDDWAVGTSDFTIEWFSRQTNLTDPPYQRVFSIGDWPNIKLGVSIESGAFYYWANNSFRFSSGSASTVNTWIHWAVVRISGVTRIYRNGTQLGSSFNDTNNITDNSTSMTVGNTLTPASNAALIGNLTNFRWVSGLGVYTGNFTIPTSSLTAIAGANPFGGSNTEAIPAGFTKLLLIP